MTDLDPRDRALLDRARPEDEPSDADRRRVRVALLAELGLGTGLAMTTAAQTSAAAVPGMAVKVMMAAAKVATVVVLSGAAAGGGFVAYRALRPGQAAVEVKRSSGQPALPHAKVTASSYSSPPVVSSVAGQNTAPAPAPAPGNQGFHQNSTAASAPMVTEPSLARTGGRGHAVSKRVLAVPGLEAEPPRLPAVAAPLRAPSTIEEETRILRAGVAALHSDDPARALALFDEHARAYPNGVLTEERWAERVTALCELGRNHEAHASARTFLRQHPRSPLSARVRASCGARSNP